MDKREIIKIALENTKILKMPKQKLSTFGTTNMNYFLLSRLDDSTRVREGKVISRKPEIISPAEISELFEGFDDYGREYAKELFEYSGSSPRMLNYRFKNIQEKTSESTSGLYDVYKKIKEDIEKGGNGLTAVIKGDESTWQISIMKFIIDMTVKSSGGNISDLEERGMFPDETGIPQNIRNKIDYLFEEARKDRSRIDELGTLLNKHNLFREYEDRFFKLLKE